MRSHRSLPRAPESWSYIDAHWYIAATGRSLRGVAFSTAMPNALFYYEAVVFTEDDANDVKVVAEFVKVLR